ncbi:hypothetical protein TrVE_jg8219 [Triparma verrucosa]|uniref:Uncharacterized protein n=1 Tax=Triparma verrucosa TaxID=1606542 RepID=A0A9W7BQS2_9STRA|nr:hypothetical protein TrVE_jg8219 [Triparma verrucosa]
MGNCTARNVNNSAYKNKRPSNIDVNCSIPTNITVTHQDVILDSMDDSPASYGGGRVSPASSTGTSPGRSSPTYGCGGGDMYGGTDYGGWGGGYSCSSPGGWSNGSGNSGCSGNSGYSGGSYGGSMGS